MMTSHAAFEATATAPAPSKLARPRKALMVILSIWAVVFLLAPIQVDWTDAMGGIVFFIVGAFFIWLGALHGERVRIPKVPRSARSGPQYAKAYWLALGLGCLGLLLRIYDWFFLRGLSLTGSSFDNREALEDGSGNMFSILALVLVPMVIAAYALRSSLRQDNIIIGTRLDFVLCLTWPALNIVVGARSAALMFIFFVLIIFLRNQRRLKSHHILLFVLFLAGLFYGMNVLLLKRISEMGVDYVEIAKISGYTHFVPLSDSFLRLIETSSESLSVSLFVIAHYTQYFLHGAFEFAHLFSEYSGDFTLGRYQMFFPVKAVGMIYGFEVSGDAILEGVPRIGVYDTFFGSAFIDFWYFALPFGFLVGFGSSVYWQRARHGDYMSLPMYIALLYIIVLVPVVNGLLFAGGIYYLMSFWVFDKFRAFVHLNGK